jgi:hypothetical protein
VCDYTCKTRCGSTVAVGRPRQTLQVRRHRGLVRSVVYISSACNPPHYLSVRPKLWLRWPTPVAFHPHHIRQVGFHLEEGCTSFSPIVGCDFVDVRLDGCGGVSSPHGRRGKLSSSCGQGELRK